MTGNSLWRMDKQIRHAILSAQVLSAMFREGTTVRFRVAKGFPADVEILQYEPDYSFAAGPALKMTVRGYFENTDDIVEIVLKTLPDEKVDNPT